MRPSFLPLTTLVMFAATVTGSDAASGTWTNTAGGTWSSTANWSGASLADGAGFTADFSTLNITADASVNVDAAHTLGTLLFGDTTASNNWSLTGSTITLDNSGSAGVIDVSGTTQATLAGLNIGTTGLNKTGTGSLVVSTTLAGSGAFRVSQGKASLIQLSGGTTGFTGSYQIDSGATLQVGNGSASSYGNLYSSGYAGTMSVTNNGTLIFNRGAQGTNNIAPIIGTGSMEVDGNGAFTQSGVGTIGGSQGLVVKSGTATLSLVNTYTGNTSITGGMLEITGQLGSGTYVGAISNAGTLKINSTSAQTLSGTISGTGALTKTNTGKLTLSVANSYSGGTTISGGTVLLGNVASLGTGAVTVNTGGILDGNALSPTNAITLAGGKIDNSSMTATVGLSGSKLTLTADSELSGSSARSYHYRYTGGTLNLNGKTLTQNGRAWVESNTTIRNGTYVLNAVLDTYGSRTTWDPTVSISIGATGNLNANSNNSGFYNVSGVSGGLLTLGGTGTTITQTGSTDRTIASKITGSYNLTINGATGITTLSGTNDYTGTTTITAGTVRLGNSAGLGANGSGSAITGTVVNTGGSLDLNGYGIGAERVELAGGSLNNTSNTNAAVETVITSATSTIKADSGWIQIGATSGNGSLAISSIGGKGVFNNTAGTFAHTGGTTINSGRLDLYTGTTVSGGPVTVAGGILNSYGANIGDNLAVTVNSGTWNVSATDTVGSIAGSGGTIVISSGATLTEGGTNDSTAYAGTISGSGGLTKTGSGTLTLSGNSSTFVGITTVSAGTLLVGGQLGGDASVSSGAVLAGGGTIGGNLSLNGGSLLDIAAALTGNSLSIGGTVTFTSGFGIDNLTGVTWSSVTDGTYTLIDTTLTNFTTAGLDNFGSANAYDIGGGRSAYFAQGSLNLVVVPEPSAAAIVGLGMLALLRRRR